jgi:hypothetical protein
MLLSVLVLAIAAVLQAAPSIAQEDTRATDERRTRAEAAIRAGRPSEAIALLEPAVREPGAAPITRLVFIVALIADGRLDSADAEAAQLEREGAASQPQLQLLKSSVSRIRSARALSTDLAPLVSAGNVRAALRKLEADPSTDSGHVFARSYLLRLLGEFDAAKQLLAEAANRATGEVAEQFVRAVAATERQQAAFTQSTESFQVLALKDYETFAGCGSAYSARSDDRNECSKALLSATSRTAQEMADISPFSAAAASARLLQAIWFGKDADARAIVRSARLNHGSVAIPARTQPDGELTAGWLVFHFDTQDIEWTDFTPGYVSRRKNGSKIPSSSTRIPFNKVSQFDQQFKVSHWQYRDGSPRFSIDKLVGADSDAASLGGVPQAQSFGLIFGEIPLRLALRTYGHVVAECLSIPENKYSLIAEKPSRMSGLLYGLAYGAIAGVATAQGNSGVRTQALQNSGARLQERSDAAQSDASVASGWRQEMSSAQLGVEKRTVQAEVASLLSGSIIPIGAQPGVPTHALEGTWREAPRSGDSNERTRFVAAESTFVVRSEDGELRGTLNSDIDFSGELKLHASRKLEFHIDTSAGTISAQLLRGEYTEDGVRRPGVGFVLRKFESVNNKLVIHFDYGLLALGKDELFGVEMNLSR